MNRDSDWVPGWFKIVWVLTALLSLCFTATVVWGFVTLVHWVVSH